MQTTGVRSTDMAGKATMLALATAVAACTACTAASSDRPGNGHQRLSRAEAGRATNWLAYHADQARSGLVVGLPRAGRLAIGWSRQLDGAVYGQPLVVGGMVVAATENDSV